MNIIDGRKISKEILSGLKAEVDRLPFRPVFCDIMVGNDPVSVSYVNIKAKKAVGIGMVFQPANYPEDIFQEDLLSEIEKLNNLPGMCGLIAQLPLPAHLDRNKILDAIDPKIDVDCNGKVNCESFYSGRPVFTPPTAGAVMVLLDRAVKDLSGKKVVVVGQGRLVGKPVTQLLRQRGIEPEIATSKTADLKELTKTADIILTGTGKPRMINADMVKPGVVIIDAGTAESSGQIVGDVDIQSVGEKAGYVSPVPGGVGPVTVSMLLKNVLEVAKQKTK